MAINRMTSSIPEASIQLVLDHLEKQILELRPKASPRG
jgi:hypothetical protein